MRALLIFATLAGLFTGGVAAEEPDQTAALRLAPDWKLPAITRHPCLLLTAEDVPALKQRLISSFGALDRVGERNLRTFLIGSERDKRKATADFIAYWKDYSQRWGKDRLDKPQPDGVSMRGIRRCILLHDLVASYGFLTEQDTADFTNAVVAAIELAIGRDPARFRVPDDGFRKMNIWTDVVAAAGVAGLAFPERPQARAWVAFALAEIDWQFARVVWDGAWHECPRYHGATLTIAGLFYEALLRRTGIDRFQDPRFKSMLDWFVRFQTPRDLVTGAALGRPEGLVLVPGIGDSSWTNVPFGILATYAPHYTRTDPRFAARLMWAWEQAGRPFDGDTVEYARELIHPEIAAEPQVLGSDCSPIKGHVVMRSGFGTPEERWLLLRCGNATRSGHDNGDWNAFNLYAFGVPLALDAGSGDYGHPTHKAWHDKSVAHNTVVFGERTQARKDGRILTWITRPEVDYVVGDGSAAAGVERFVRRVLFVKPDYYVIWDEIRAKEPTRWMLHTTATDFVWSPHGVRCSTPWKVDLDVQVVWPVTALVPGTQKGRIGDWTREDERRNEPLPMLHQDYLGIPNVPGKPFLVVLHPLRSGQAPLVVRDAGRPDRPILDITCGKQVDHVELGPDTALVRRTGPVTTSVVLGPEKR